MFKHHAETLNVVSRVLTAFLGGFILSNLSVVLIAELLSGNKVDNIVVGSMTSFVIYTLIILCVFSVKTAYRAFIITLTPCCLMLLIIMYLSMDTAL